MTLEQISEKTRLPIEQFICREDGRVEWICKHGVGHTVYNPNDWEKYKYTHGCDGCCSSIKLLP
jgi:hypothetical protein